jgi:asparagine synthase (glutamine-hydrolysing)
MCGIFAFLDFEQNQVDIQTLEAMSSSIAHRGPDDCGFAFFELRGRQRTIVSKAMIQKENLYPLEGALVFGHRRLSIIDLSEAGHQPMCNETGEIWVIYNGEIYNYQELAEELTGKGHFFKSRTDTEVILHAYEEWGIECLNRFNGMWAFALWDRKQQRLFCSRDRFGIKPLYYSFNGQKFMMASEIKTLLQDSAIERAPNHSRIYDYLEYGYLDHTEETFFKNIYQLRGSHYLTVDLLGTQTVRLDIQRYWDIERKEMNEGDPFHVRFFELFEDSIRIHMRSDVPVGTCLSGGLDSSSIVMVAKRFLSSNSHQTFSSCFKEKKYDEREFIDLVSKSAETESHFIFPKAEDLFGDIGALIWHQDEPFESTSVYAQWNVFRLTKLNQVKVVLDGQGGDELLAGYHVYFGAYLAELLRKFRLQKFLREYRRIRTLYHYAHAWLIQYMLRSMVSPQVVDILRILKGQNPKWLKSIDAAERPLVFPKKFKNLFFDNLFCSLMHVSLPRFLHYEDRNSMAHSIEARVPFLDYRIVEFIFSLPVDQIIADGTTKVILREAMKGILPEKVRTRMDKMGYVTPEDTWFRGPLKSEIEDIIGAKSFAERGYFEVGEIKKAFAEHCAGKVDLGSTIWRWVNLELWFRTFIDQRMLAKG